MTTPTTSQIAVMLLISTSLLMSGCTNDDESIHVEENQDNQTTSEDSGNDDTDAGNHAADANDDESEEFEKPPPPDSPLRDRHFYTGEEIGYHMWGREHMHWTSSLHENWLYPGEYFVRDGYIYPTGVHWPQDEEHPRKFEVFVLSDGEQLPMRFIEVHDESEFPSIEEIESWDDDDFSERTTFELDPDSPLEVERPFLNYTLVVPPWAFGEERAHDIQVMIVPLWEPLSSTPMLMRLGFIAGGFPVANMNHTVYYGSEDSPPPSENIEHRQSDATDVGDEFPEEFFLHTRLRFLAPPVDIHDWRDVDSPFDAALGDVLEVSEPDVTLELYIGGIRVNRSSEEQRIAGFGEHIYYVFQDHELIDTFRYDLKETDPSTTMEIEPQKRLDIDISLPLDGSDTTVQVFSSFLEYDSAVESDAPQAHTNAALESNALIMRYEPKKSDTQP